MKVEKPLTVKDVREFLADKDELSEVGVCIHGRIVPLIYKMELEGEYASTVVFMGPLFPMKQER